MKKTLIYYKKWKPTKKHYTNNSLSLNSCYCVKSLNNISITESTFSTIKIKLKKFYKKKAYFNFSLNKQKLLTYKSLGMRMGKGKGSKKKKIYLINKGNIFLEIKESKLRNQKDFNLFISILTKKLAFKTQTIKKNLLLNI